MRLKQQIEIVKNDVNWWQPVLFGAMAGGMGWGIRGQYGHETGAMIAGLLVSLVLVYLLCPHFSKTNAARTIALVTAAMGLGGSMTYGQTVGLTHDTALVGHWDALSWGMLGLAIKGGVWIGFAGTFLGMALGGKRYRPGTMALLMLSMVGAYFVGLFILNSPFDPENQKLPWLYFSDHWYWEPNKELEPRHECWGGLFFALILLLIYTRGWRKESLALRMGLWGILGGALGFPLGQSLQAFHAWNPEIFQEGIWKQLDPHMNWWNMMETTYGAVMGAMLGLGLWLNRKRIQAMEESEESLMPFPIEWILLLIHLPMLILVEFHALWYVDMFYDLGLIMAIIPMIAIAGGRWWPYLQIFPLTLLPIAGKTVRNLVYENDAIQPVLGWPIYFIIPMALSIFLVIWFKQRIKEQPSLHFTGYTLLINTWMYFFLNFAIFRYPWPWTEWTGRTPNGIIFTICAIGLTIAVCIHLSSPRFPLNDTLSERLDCHSR